MSVLKNPKVVTLAVVVALMTACGPASTEPASDAPKAQDDPGAAVSTVAVAPPAAEEGATPYTVECAPDPETGAKVCSVDKKTFVGWRTYHAFCHVCHAQDAVGSTFAPSLIERMQQIDKARFIDSLANGYTGQMGVMPPWKDNPNISKRYEELYAYLMARADGVLTPGRPKKMKVSE